MADLTLGAGWLAKDETLPFDNHGVHVPRWAITERLPFPTRSEEYWWLAASLEAAPRGFVLDAGTGFAPDIHLVPYILANMGFTVLAIDSNPHTLQMPPHPEVLRCCANLQKLPIMLMGVVDYWVCVSTLEHLSEDAKHEALHEAFRVLRSGGYALLTTDETAPSTVVSLLRDHHFLVADADDTEPAAPLAPRVAWAIAQKP